MKKYKVHRSIYKWLFPVNAYKDKNGKILWNNAILADSSPCNKSNGKLIFFIV